jgi:hypothetical protein
VASGSKEDRVYIYRRPLLLGYIEMTEEIGFFHLTTKSNTSSASSYPAEVYEPVNRNRNAARSQHHDFPIE